MPADPELRYADVADAALGALVAERDGRALEALYDRYGSACYALARRVVVDAQLAQDVVQEVFLSLWRGAGGFDVDRGSLATYLLSITHHKAVDAVRKEERQRSRQVSADVLDFTDSGQDVDEDAWTAVRRTRVRTMLAELPEQQREALLLAYFGGYTQQEIATLTGTPLGTVKTRTLAALRKLRTGLAGYDENGTGGAVS